MKRFALTLVFIIALLLLAGCGSIIEGLMQSPPQDAPEPDTAAGDAIAPNNLWTVTDGITLRLLQDAYLPNAQTMTLILENRSDSVMSYGQGWSFEKHEDGEWRTLETIENYGFTLEGYLLFDHDRKTFTIGTWFLNEPLSEGLYRVTGCSLRVAPDDQNLAQLLLGLLRPFGVFNII